MTVEMSLFTSLQCVETNPKVHWTCCLLQHYFRIIFHFCRFFEGFHRLSKLNIGWSGGAMVLGKLLVPGRLASSDNSRARAYCAFSRCGWGLFGHFHSRLSVLHSFFLPLWETGRYRLKYCLKRPFNPNQPTNQPTKFNIIKDNILSLPYNLRRNIKLFEKLTKHH